MKVAIQGEPGSFSHEAARRMLPGCTIVPCARSAEVFDRLEAGKVPIAVIPIENSILYVSPLYLRAETGQLPELKRVIAAYGDRVVMEETLGAALAALFKDTAPPPARPTAAGAATSAGPADPEAFGGAAPTTPRPKDHLAVSNRVPLRWRHLWSVGCEIPRD